MDDAEPVTASLQAAADDWWNSVSAYPTGAQEAMRVAAFCERNGLELPGDAARAIGAASRTWVEGQHATLDEAFGVRVAGGQERRIAFTASRKLRAAQRMALLRYMFGLTVGQAAHAVALHPDGSGYSVRSLHKLWEDEGYGRDVRVALGKPSRRPPPGECIASDHLRRLVLADFPSPAFTGCLGKVRPWMKIPP